MKIKKQFCKFQHLAFYYIFLLHSLFMRLSLYFGSMYEWILLYICFNIKKDQQNFYTKLIILRTQRNVSSHAASQHLRPIPDRSSTAHSRRHTHILGLFFIAALSALRNEIDT